MLSGLEQASETAGTQISEVDIPNVGKVQVRHDADGYNEEVSGRLEIGQGSFGQGSFAY